MYFTSTLFISICVLAAVEGWADNKVRSFPETFMFGAGSAAYQVEGAWDEDDKSESIWDRFLHTHPELLPDGRNGDVACDSYHQYKRDVEMLREMGVDHYRFSIAWPRVLPTGFPNAINEKGFAYYDNLIAELLKYNIEPMITLYHFDLPQRLQDLGGWANPYSVDWFEDYAGVVFQRYADKVKYWITINQPNTICMEGYGSGVMAPGVDVNGVADYLCVKNVMLAHARAYRLYQRTYREKYNGAVGIAIALNWFEPFNNKTENVKAAEKIREFTIGLYVNPIWGENGDFPKLVQEIVAKKSKEEGFLRSRLPSLSEEERKLLKGSADFLGMNHYTTFLVKPSKKEFPSPSFEGDIGVELSQGDTWYTSASSWLKSYPFGIYRTLHHLNVHYSYPVIIITEHGFSSRAVSWDNSRASNLRQYMKALLLAMEDGADVRGYTAWSLADNVEWTQGTSERFGLYQVDFESEAKTRTPRLSALVYKRLIETRVVDLDWKPDTLDIAISDRRMRKVNKKTEL